MCIKPEGFDLGKSMLSSIGNSKYCNLSLPKCLSFIIKSAMFHLLEILPSLLVKDSIFLQSRNTRKYLHLLHTLSLSTWKTLRLSGSITKKLSKILKTEVCSGLTDYVTLSKFTSTSPDILEWLSSFTDGSQQHLAENLRPWNIVSRRL